jgi:hypothetical protein
MSKSHALLAGVLLVVLLWSISAAVAILRH